MHQQLWLMIWFMAPNLLHLCNRPAAKGLSTQLTGSVCSSSRQLAALPFGLVNAPPPLQYAKPSDLNQPPQPAPHEVRQTPLAQMEPPPMDTQSVGGAGGLFRALSAELYGPHIVVSIF